MSGTPGEASFNTSCDSELWAPTSPILSANGKKDFQKACLGGSAKRSFTNAWTASSQLRSSWIQLVLTFASLTALNMYCERRCESDSISAGGGSAPAWPFGHTPTRVWKKSISSFRSGALRPSTSRRSPSTLRVQEESADAQSFGISERPAMRVRTFSAGFRRLAQATACSTYLRSLSSTVPSSPTYVRYTGKQATTSMSAARRE